MKRRERICFQRVCFLAGIDTGFWSRRGIIITAMVAMALLPANVGNAGWLSDVFKSPSTPDKPPKHPLLAKAPALAKAPHRKGCRLEAGRVEARCVGNKVRSLDIPHRSWMWGIPPNRQARSAPAGFPGSPSICA